MLVLDVVVTGGNSDAMRRRENVAVRVAYGRLELVTGQLKQLPVGVSKVDRVHKATIDITCVPDPPFIQPLSNLGIGGTRDIQGKEMGGRLGPAKGKDFDSGNAIGPVLVTPDEIPDPYNLIMKAQDLPEATLSASPEKAGPRLGWTSWIKTKEFTADDTQVILSVARANAG